MTDDVTTSINHKTFSYAKWRELTKKLWRLPGAPVAKTPWSQSRGPGSILGQGTGSWMPQLRVHVPQGRGKIPYAATKTQCSQTNKVFKKKLTKGMYCMTLFLWSAKIGKIHPWRKKCINSSYLVWCIQLSSYIQWSKLLNKMFNTFWWITYKWHLN